jgi:hypothetical protein
MISWFKIAAAVSAGAASAMAPAAAAPILFGNTVSGQVRLATDSASTNYFSPGTAVVDFTTEFSTAITIGGVQFDISADLQPVLEPRIVIVVGLHIVTNAFSPELIFTFSNLAFTPAANVTGVTNEPGSTSGLWDAPSLLSATSVQMVNHSSFLSNGGALQGSFVLIPAEVPEPATSELVFLAGSAIVCGAIYRRRRTGPGERAGLATLPPAAL